jgi:hypothetical protein
MIQKMLKIGNLRRKKKTNKIKILREGRMASENCQAK